MRTLLHVQRPMTPQAQDSRLGGISSSLSDELPSGVLEPLPWATDARGRAFEEPDGGALADVARAALDWRCAGPERRSLLELPALRVAVALLDRDERLLPVAELAVLLPELRAACVVFGAEGAEGLLLDFLAVCVVFGAVGAEGRPPNECKLCWRNSCVSKEMGTR